MTAREAKQLLGSTGSLATLDGLTVDVKILDVREVYGRVDFLVTPVAGSGQVWKQAGNVKVSKGGSK